MKLSSTSSYHLTTKLHIIIHWVRHVPPFIFIFFRCSIRLCSSFCLVLCLLRGCGAFDWTKVFASAMHSAFYISFLFSIFRRSVSSTMPFSGCRSLHLYSTYEKNKNNEQQRQNQLQRIWWIIVRANRMRWNFINSDMHTIIPTDNWQAEIKTNKQTENKLNNHIILGWKMFVPLRHILIKCVGRVWAIFICSCCAMANNMCST